MGSFQLRLFYDSMECIGLKQTKTPGETTGEWKLFLCGNVPVYLSGFPLEMVHATTNQLC